MIMPVEVRSSVDFGSDVGFLQTKIYATTGQVAYTLTCRGITEAYLDRVADELGVNYVGPWMCVLNAGDRETEANLLGPKGLPAWMGRNVFTRKALVSPCMNDPYYGARRAFLLRGMRIEMGFESAEKEIPLSRMATFYVRVRPDLGARSAVGDPELPKAHVEGCDR